MLTIQNYHKLNHRDIVDNWWVKAISAGTHNNTYIILLEKLMNGIVADFCTIMLERNGIEQHSSTHPTEMAYFFIYNSQRTNVCATADWLSDIDNMIGQIGHILKENNKADWQSI
jgi:hypothetical protein